MIFKNFSKSKTGFEIFIKDFAQNMKEMLTLVQVRIGHLTISQKEPSVGGGSLKFGRHVDLKLEHPPMTRPWKQRFKIQKQKYFQAQTQLKLCLC